MDLLDETKADYEQELFKRRLNFLLPWLGGATLLIILASSLYAFWQHSEHKKTIRLSELLYAASLSAPNSQIEPITKQLMEAGLHDSHHALAGFLQLQEAITLQHSPQSEKAISILHSIYQNDSYPIELRSISSLRAAYILIENGQINHPSLIQYLTFLINPDNPFYLLGLEINVALSWLKQDYPLARSQLELLLQKTSQNRHYNSIHQRAKELAHVLAMSGVFPDKEQEKSNPIQK
jgi:hypothetical protein